MKLFGDYETVKFYEENLIFITRGGYIYYIYNPEYDRWQKYRNAGNDHITVHNYDDVSKEELIDAMKGKFPTKETDFMRLCDPSQLKSWDIFNLLKEDYPKYMADYLTQNTVDTFLQESRICYKSYLKLRNLFDDALSTHKDSEQVLSQIKELSLAVIGRDIYKDEIGIVDGHDSSSYFWIMPVRVIDYENTDSMDNVAEMRRAEISIEEYDVSQYLAPFLYRYFDGELEANKKRVDDHWIDDDKSERFTYTSNFEWYLTYNFYTFDSMERILSDIKDTIAALSSGQKNDYTAEIKRENDTPVELIIDFYRRFIYRMEYMMTVGKENGYDLISFMGP